MRWWVDILDCRKSFYRRLIKMSFESIMQKFDEKCYFSVIHRDRGIEPEYIEVAFSTSSSPSYFLWIMVGMKYAKMFAHLLQRPKQAWRTSLIGVESVVAAETAGKAAAKTIKAAKDAGFPVIFTEVRVRRAHEFDQWALSDVSDKVWDETMLRRNLAGER